ncbi:14454_t:CDS:1 [Dentiscutata erythropus]|uniref:14454_t:CDS:1 n=1 Tax=Dentiscutata erythropus TaxID=1348616 RepID=A0A9N9B0A0_9GLOM|nr:14454_t:CDS:1 [Dentiscutata erythropus]
MPLTKNLKAILIIEVIRKNGLKSSISTLLIDNKPILTIQNKNWPSLQKIALTALLILLTIAPKESKVTIYTNSTFLKKVKTGNNIGYIENQKINKQNFGGYIMGVNTLLDIKFIELIVEPIETKPQYKQKWVETEFISAKIIANNFFAIMKKQTLLYNMNFTIKIIQQMEKYNNWLNQERIKQLQNAHHGINWKLVYEYLSLKDKPSIKKTNPKRSKLKSFKIKMLTDELPTFANLYKRHSTKYKSSNCHRCNIEIENKIYWLICKNNSTKLNQIISQAIDKTGSKNKKVGQQQCQNLSNFRRIHVINQIPIRVIIPEKYQISTSVIAIKDIVKLYNIIVSYIHEEIWIPSQIDSYNTNSLNSSNINNMQNQQNQNLNTNNAYINQKQLKHNK